MKGRLRGINMFSFLVHAIIGIRMLTLPRDVVKYAKNDAWISMIIMSAVILITSYIFLWIANKYPGKDFSQINKIVLGRALGNILLVPIGIYITASIALSLRLFAYSIKIFLLDRTPITITMAIILLAAFYCLRKDIKTMSIVLDILLPISLIASIALVLLPITSADPGNLLPVMHNGVIPIIKGSLQIVDPVLGCGAIAYVLPYFSEVKGIKKVVTWGVITASSVYISTIIMSLMVFGSNEINYILFPSITITKAIQIRSVVVERAESLFMVSWIPTTFCTILIYFLAGTLNIKALLNVKKDKIIMYAQLPIFLVIALIPQNIVELSKLLQYNAFLAQGLNLVYLPLFALTVYIKSRRKKDDV